MFRASHSQIIEVMISSFTTHICAHRSPSMNIHIFRADLLHCLRTPQAPSDYEYLVDGGLLIENGIVKNIGPFDQIRAQCSQDTAITHYPNHLIVPGFIDCHVHFPQIDIIAAYGEHLLSWLTKYVYPAEERYADLDYCQHQAKLFLSECLRNGTTTALVFTTTHPQSAQALFEAADRRNMRLISGPVFMDQNAPSGLTNYSCENSIQTQNIISRWHGHNRLQVALMPRFAPTSSEKQLATIGRLFIENPDLYLHSHLAENQQEILWVKQLFPWAKDYLEVYERYNLVNPRSIFAHAIHLSDHELARLAAHNAALVFCPCANLFLGSGLFNLDKAKQNKIRVGIGTDVGAGTSFSLLANLNNAYKILQLQNQKLTPIEGLYMLTLGAAKTLSLDHVLGNFTPGKEADFVVLDPSATPLLKHRQSSNPTIEELWFLLATLGDDRIIAATYILGECAHQRGKTSNSRRDT